MLASTKSGALGSSTSSLNVFQDFFADLDLPVKLTQGDRVSIPVAIYNYAGMNGEVNLNLQTDTVVRSGGGQQHEICIRRERPCRWQSVHDISQQDWQIQTDPLGKDGMEHTTAGHRRAGDRSRSKWT